MIWSYWSGLQRRINASLLVCLVMMLLASGCLAIQRQATAPKDQALYHRSQVENLRELANQQDHQALLIHAEVPDARDAVYRKKALAAEYRKAAEELERTAQALEEEQ